MFSIFRNLFTASKPPVESTLFDGHQQLEKFNPVSEALARVQSSVTVADKTAALATPAMIDALTHSKQSPFWEKLLVALNVPNQTSPVQFRPAGFAGPVSQHLCVEKLLQVNKSRFRKEPRLKELLFTVAVDICDQTGLPVRFEGQLLDLRALCEVAISSTSSPSDTTLNNVACALGSSGTISIGGVEHSQLELLERAMKVSPPFSNGNLHLNLATVYGSNGDEAKKKEFLEYCFLMPPDHSFTSSSSFTQRAREVLVDYCKEVIAKNPTNLTAWKHLVTAVRCDEVVEITTEVHSAWQPDGSPSAERPHGEVPTSQSAANLLEMATDDDLKPEEVEQLLKRCVSLFPNHPLTTPLDSRDLLRRFCVEKLTQNPTLDNYRRHLSLVLPAGESQIIHSNLTHDQIARLGLRRTNVVLCGKRGAGKSSLINYIVGATVAKVNAGPSVTKYATYYSHEAHGFNFLDTRGLENGRKAECKQLIRELSERSWSAGEQVHQAWICIEEGSSRFQDADIELIDYFNRVKIPSFVVLTKCDDPDYIPKDNGTSLSDDIRDRAPRVCGVFRTSTKAHMSEDDIPITIEPFGIDELLVAATAKVKEELSSDVSAVDRMALMNEQLAARGVAIDDDKFKRSSLYYHQEYERSQRQLMMYLKSGGAEHVSKLLGAVEKTNQ